MHSGGGAARDFDQRDVAGAPAVAIVNESMARRFWPDKDAVGQRIRLGDAAGREVTVVGVARNARFRDFLTDLDAPTTEPDVYFPFAQSTDGDLEIVVRAVYGAVLSLDQLQRTIYELDAGLQLYAVRPLTDHVKRQSAAPRFGSFALSAAGLFATLLAAIGVYGVIAFVVGLSRAEIAIRMALGADAREVLKLVVRNGLTLVGVGVVLGVFASLALSPMLSDHLFGVDPRDPLTLGVMATVLLGIAFFAAWLPARQTLRVEAHAVLRTE